MKTLILLLVLLPLTATAQDFPFVQEYDTIPVSVNGWDLQVPWMLGFEKSKPCFGDLDNDGDQDLLVGDNQGNVYYFQNDGSGSIANFHLITNDF